MNYNNLWWWHAKYRSYLIQFEKKSSSTRNLSISVGILLIDYNIHLSFSIQRIKHTEVVWLGCHCSGCTRLNGAFARHSWWHWDQRTELTSIRGSLWLHRTYPLRSTFISILTVTRLCICRRIIAALLPDMSQGRTQCFTPLAAYEFSFITQMQPRGNGTTKAPLQKP